MKRWIRNRFANPTTVAPRAKRLDLVSLEDRTVPATFTVTTGADTGTGSLREAIASANANSEADTITFDSAVTTVTLTSAELSLTKVDLVSINGGSGVTITRDSSAAEFRLLTVAANAKADLLGLTLTNGKATGDGAAGYGGGILINSGATVTLTNATLSGNTAKSGGGGIFNNNTGTVTLTNATLSGNSATNFGGGISNGGTVTLTNATVTTNRADADGNGSGTGGGIGIFGGTATLFNTIVTGNFVGTGATADEVDGTIDAASKNNITSGDAKLGPLANNGGPTRTHTLLASSPAIDAGDQTLAGVPATDQRGLVRVAGSNVDIGAYEVQTVSIAPTTLPGGTVGVVYDQQLTANFLNQPSGTTYTFAQTGALPAGLTLSTAGKISGIPTAGGSKTFSVLATANTGDFAVANFTIKINTIPVANADTASTTNATLVTIDVLANDTDANNDPLTITAVGKASKGTTAVSSGKVTYTPNATFAGSDSFTYTISDGQGGTASANVLASLDQRGCVDLPFIARLYGQDESRVIAELGNLIFENPQTHQWETADAYLSGNVRVKWKQAEATGPSFARNASALQAVQPDDVLPGEIDANLGVPWIPASDVHAFAVDLFGVPPDSVALAHLPKDALWSVEPNWTAQQSVAATTEFGTDRISGFQLLEQALNLKTPTI